MSNVSSSSYRSAYPARSTAPQKRADTHGTEQARPITTTTTTTVTTTTTAVTRTTLESLGTTSAKHAPAELQAFGGTETSPTWDGEGLNGDTDPNPPAPATNAQPSASSSDERAHELAQLSAQALAVQQANREGLQALFEAIDANDPSKVLAVLMLTPLLNEPLEDGSTPLQLAVRQGKGKVVSYLLAHPAIEINKAGADGLAPLHEAAKSGDATTAALLLKQHKIRLNITTPSGETPYHIALRYGRTKIAQLLLDKGVNTTLTMRNGFTPVHCACESGSLATLEWLLKQPTTLQRHGVALTMDTVLNRPSLDGSTPLLIAVQSGDAKLVAFLLKQTVVAPKLANRSGDTPLHLAIKGGQTAVVELLLKSGCMDIEAVNNEGATPFFLAIESGSRKFAELLLPPLLAKSAYVNQPTKAGLKPLHAACLFGDVALVKWLLEQPMILQGKRKAFKMSTVLNQATDEGKTPLRLAVDSQSRGLVKYLLAQKVLPNKPDAQGDTPLHAAVKAGNEFLATLLLQHADMDVNKTNLEGVGAFALAIMNGDTAMCEQLVAHGANIHQADANGVTALHLVCERQNPYLLDWLLKLPQTAVLDGKKRRMAESLNQRDHGGNTLWSYAIGTDDAAEAVVKRLLEQPGVALDLGDLDGRTPMHMACGLGQLNIANMLADEGADIDRADASGATPLHLACDEGETAVVEWLLKRLAAPMPNGRLRDMPVVLNKTAQEGKTALYLAAEQGHDKIVQILLKHPGIRPNLAAQDGTTALHVAIAAHDEDILELLLLHRDTTVDPWSAFHGTPLHLAIAASDLQFADVLVSRGADINRPDPRGFTPLHIACQQGDFRTVRWLLKRPEIRLLNGSPRTATAVLNQPAQAGETPLLLAVSSGSMDVILYLLQNGSDPNQARPNGMAPLHEATRMGHTHAVDALLKCAHIDVFQKGPNGNTVLHFIEASKQAKSLIAVYQKALGLATFNRLAHTLNARGDPPAAIASATGPQSVDAGVAQTPSRRTRPGQPPSNT